MQPRVFLSAVVVGLVVTSAFFACGGATSASSADAGMDATKVKPHDAGITQFEASLFDAFVVLPEASVPDAGAFDATSTPDAPGPVDGGADHVVVDGHPLSDTGTDTGTVVDSGVDAPKRDTGACTMLTVPGTTAAAAVCVPPEAGACGPAVLSGFTPSPPPPKPAQNVCTTAQIQSIYDDCINGDSCPEDGAGDPALDCYNCIFSNQSNATWGPVVNTTVGLYELNLGGCLQLLEPCNALCAQTVVSDLLCDEQACMTNCPITAAPASQTAYNACATTADGCDPGGCYLYGNGAYGNSGCVTQLINESGHPGAVCFSTSATSFEDEYLIIAPVFCGPQ